MLNHVLFNSAAGYPDYPALGFAGEEPFNYSSCANLVDRLAARLVSDGILPGERVGLLSENMPHWGIAYMAINRAGGIVVPVLPDFHPEDIASILSHAGIKACFISRRLSPKLDAAGFTGSPVSLYLADSLAPLQNLKTESITAAESLSADDFLPEKGFSYPGSLKDPAVIIYTSGTTGHSKGVVLSNENIIFNAEKTSVIPGIKPGESMLSILPLAHTYECTIGLIIPLLMGCGVYYLRRPPSATVLMPALKKVRPHLILSVPLLIEKLYRQSVLPSFKKSPLLRRLHATTPGRKILNRLAGKKLRKAFGGRLYFFGIGGAALAPEVEDFLIEAKFPYAIGYGLTETSPLIAGSDNPHMKARSTGKPIEGIEVKIADPDDETGEGEILVRGPIVMQGYYKAPEKTAEVIDNDGWFHTGDLGFFDDDGRLYIKGRMKNLILGPSGENIYPEAIESIINSFDFVEDSLVFQDQGELSARIHINYDAFMEHLHHLAESAADFPREIREYLNELRKSVNNRLSSFSRIGKFIEQKEPFEKTPTQKIKRFLYDALHRHGHDDSNGSNGSSS
jgi:long-chain acyl-CoA synthetase